MKYRVERRNQVTMDEFLEKHGLELVVRERDIDIQRRGLKRWIADITQLEVKDGCCLVSSYGEGETPDEAAIDYVKQISCKPLVLYAYSIHRKDIPSQIIVP